MQIRTELRDNINIINLTGEIDLSNSPILRKKFSELTNNKSPNILVDLSEVPYMDSSGLATLVEAMQRVNKNNGTFKLKGIKGTVKNIFEISRLTEVFSIE